MTLPELHEIASYQRGRTATGHAAAASVSSDYRCQAGLVRLGHAWAGEEPAFS